MKLDALLSNDALGRLIVICTILVSVGVAFGAIKSNIDAVETTVVQLEAANIREHENFVTERRLEALIDGLDRELKAIKSNQDRILDYLQNQK